MGEFLILGFGVFVVRAKPYNFFRVHFYESNNIILSFQYIIFL